MVGAGALGFARIVAVDGPEFVQRLYRAKVNVR